MSEIHFLNNPSRPADLCKGEPESLEDFLRCNPRAPGPNATLPGYFSYIIDRRPSIQARLVSDHFNSLSLTSRKNLSQCVATYGDDIWTLVEFYDRVLSDVSLADVGQHVNGTAGVGTAVLAGRAQSFQGALHQYQQALINLNQYTRVGRVAASRRAELRREVMTAYENLNRYFTQEMSRVRPSALRHRNRGSALSNAERGITLAERSRGRGIHVADAHEGRKVGRFADSLRHVGTGLIAIDVGFRGGKVHQAYRNDEDWVRELAVQGGGFAGSSVAGFSAGRIAFMLGRVALVGSPLGWFVLIGSTVAVGAIAGYQMDKVGQDAAAWTWKNLSLRR